MPDGLQKSQRIWAYLAVAIAILMAVLDSSIVNVALPAIARDLGMTASEAIWIVNGYQLAITISLLPLSSLGDIWGYKRVYCCGLAVFTVASLLCAQATDLPVLLLARILQGFGAAGIMSVNLALVRFIFPPQMLGWGVGLTAMIVAMAAAAGPSVSALILSIAHWQWLFLVNLPLGSLALGVGLWMLPVTPASGARFDFRSAALSALTFGLLISGLDSIGRSAWAVPPVALCAAALFGTWLTRRQLQLPSPLLPVDLLRRPAFALTMATSICAFTAQTLVYVSLPFFFQNMLGRSAVETGVLLTPWPLAISLSAPVAGRLADHYTPARLGGLGLAIMSCGLLLLFFMPSHASSLDIAWRLAVCGLGFGLFQSPNNKAIITAAPPGRSGSASGMQSTARLLGQSTGAALAAIIFTVTGEERQVWVALALGVAITAAGAITSSLRRFDKPAQA